MEIKELYEIYGQLSIEVEILNSNILTVKKQIAEKLNPPVTIEKKKVDKPEEIKK